MSDSPNVDPDLATEAPKAAKQPKHPDVEVTSADEVDPSDGTDNDDLPVDNPAG